jgi:hypothetical protein
MSRATSLSTLKTIGTLWLDQSGKTHRAAGAALLWSNDSCNNSIAVSIAKDTAVIPGCVSKSATADLDTQARNP